MELVEMSQSARSKRSDLVAETISMTDTAKMLGCSYGTLQELVRAGKAPVTPIRVGRIYKFPSRKVHALLGIDDATK